MRRLLVLMALLAVAAVVIAWPARRRAPEAPAAPRVLPDTAITVVLGRQGLSPERTEVPKDHRVALTLSNHTGRAVSVALAGYEGRLDIGRLEDGDTWCGTFVSELPGDDFAWLVDGHPAGRFAVTGSHLTEGHR